MKLNINIEGGLDVGLSIRRVLHIIENGRVSAKDSFCTITTWRDGVVIHADKTKAGNDTLRVFYDEIWDKRERK